MTNVDTCPFCEIFVKARDKVICCDLCNKWIYVQKSQSKKHVLVL